MLHKLHMMLCPLSPCVMTRTTLISFPLFSGAPSSGFPVYICKYHAYDKAAFQAAKTLIPYFAGLLPASHVGWLNSWPRRPLYFTVFWHPYFYTCWLLMGCWRALSSKIISKASWADNLFAILTDSDKEPHRQSYFFCWIPSQLG